MIVMVKDNGNFIGGYVIHSLDDGEVDRLKDSFIQAGFLVYLDGNIMFLDYRG